MINVERDTEGAGSLRVQLIADIERLPRCVDAGAVGGVGGMQRLDCQRHLRGTRVVQHFGEGILDLGPRRRNIL